MKFNFFKSLMIVGMFAELLQKALADGVLTGDEAIEIIKLIAPVLGIDLSKPIVQ